MKFWKGKWQKYKTPQMVKKQGKDEKIFEKINWRIKLTMHCYKLKHTNEKKWLNFTKKMNNEKLQED